MMSKRHLKKIAIGLFILSIILACDIQDIAIEEGGGESTPIPINSDSSSGEWYLLFFTAPTYPDKEESRPKVVPIVNALAQAINAAQSTVDIAIYELDLPAVGEAILKAKERGVKVRIVTDSDTLEELEVLQDLEKAGIPMVEDERSAIMHNKFVVIDKKAVWTGSWNFTPNGTYRNNNHGILIESSQLAENYSLEFAEMFEDGQFGPKSPANTKYPQLDIGGTLVETCFAPEDDCGDLLMERIDEAKKSIHFMAFSFTHDGITDVVLNRMKSGVTVRGVFENRGSNTEYSAYGKLDKAGADVMTDGNPYTMHHKVFIIDEKTVVLGSFNFSKNADSSNDENILIVHSPTMAQHFIAEFERVYATALNPPNK